MLSQLLLKRADDPIRVGIIGAGKFGGGIVAQISQMKGMSVCAVADVDIELAMNSFNWNLGLELRSDLEEEPKELDCP